LSAFVVFDMANFILVKHCPPVQKADVPAAQWELSEKGRELCRPLAVRLQKSEPSRIIASPEPKATETGRLVAQYLNLPFVTVPGLHEHERNKYFPTPAEFEAAVTRFFAYPAELTLGNETATAARLRFEQALHNVLKSHPEGNNVIVAHGTVITLFVAAHNKIELFEFWRKLGLPSIVVLSSDYKITEVVEELS
jgi:broad specificity phosphatase PhoE